VLADPLALPGPLVALLVAARAVDRGEFLCDLLPVRAPAAGHLVRADVDAPTVSGSSDPALRLWVVKRQRVGRGIVGRTRVHDGVGLRVRIGIGLVHDRVHSGAAWWRPPPEQPGPFERVPGQRPKPDHALVIPEVGIGVRVLTASSTPSSWPTTRSP